MSGHGYYSRVRGQTRQILDLEPRFVRPLDRIAPTGIYGHLQLFNVKKEGMKGMKRHTGICPAAEVRADLSPELTEQRLQVRVNSLNVTRITPVTDTLIQVYFSDGDV